MAASAERLPNRPGLHVPPPPATADEKPPADENPQADKKPAADKPPSPLGRYLGALLGILSIPLGLLLCLICLGVWLSVGYVIGKVSPADVSPRSAI